MLESEMASYLGRFFLHKNERHASVQVSLLMCAFLYPSLRTNITIISGLEPERQPDWVIKNTKNKTPQGVIFGNKNIFVYRINHWIPKRMTHKKPNTICANICNQSVSILNM